MEGKPLTLYELNSLVRGVIESTLNAGYWVEAELSEAREVRGHCYMELIQKEPFSSTPVARASAKCWKNRWGALRPKFERVTGQPLHAGLKVLLWVTASFHEAYGFAWIVQDIDPTYTLGDMARKRMEIIRQLKAEGVFELQKELLFPMFAQHVAVISSENAAGYGDFCNQLHNNSHGLWFSTTLFPAVMQGDQVEPSVIDEAYPNGHPQVAQVAIQQAKNLAKNLKKINEGEGDNSLTAFKYNNLGSMATIGRNKAVVEIGKFRSQGFFAWILWLIVHLRSILGVKNKMMVLLNWLWKYVSYNDSIRMITYATKPREVQERIKREQRTHLGEDLME